MGLVKKLLICWINIVLCMLFVYYRVFRSVIDRLRGKKWPESTQKETAPGKLETQNLRNIQQISEPGFGDSRNRYAFSMAVFKDKVYVGTSHIHRPIPGIYQFVFGSPLTTSGTQVYAYDDQKNRWDNVLKNGWHDKTNFAVRKLLVIDDFMLAATVNHEKGMEVWGTLDGTNWKVLAKGGFGNSNNTSGRGITEFQDKIYFTTENRESGAELWRCDKEALRNALDAAESGVYTLDERWERVVANGFGVDTNFWFSDLVIFNDHLYLGTMNNVQGFSLYRSPNGQQFDRIAKNGISTFFNHAAMRLFVFKGELYVSTMNWVEGFSLYVMRTPKENAKTIDFDRVLAHGFTSVYNTYVWQMVEYEGRLYAGTFQNSFTGLRFGMFSLYSSADGRNWVIETDSAFSPKKGLSSFLCPQLGDYGIRTMAVHNNKLYLGTATAHNSCKVYTVEAKKK